MKFRVYFPVTNDMSPIDYIVKDGSMTTKEEDALWHYNKSREHDGLRPIDCVNDLPKGTKFVPVY